MAVVKFSQSSIRKMIVEAGSSVPDETGGILLGYWTVEFKEAIVLYAIGPGPCAIRSPAKFYPDGEYHWKVIEQIFTTTNGKVTYLGDWHSHPQGGRNLSWLDRSTLKKIAQTPESQTNHPLMVILMGHDSWVINVWGYDHRPWRERKNVRRFVSHQVGLM